MAEDPKLSPFTLTRSRIVLLILGALLLVTALSGGRRRRTGTIRNPYAERVPLTSLSKGILAPEEIGERE